MLVVAVVLRAFGIKDDAVARVARLQKETARCLLRVRAVTEEGCQKAWVGQVWFFEEEGCRRAQVGQAKVHVVVSCLILVLQNLDEVGAG